MDRIKTTESFVLNALETNERARADDFILYGAVLKRMGIDLGTSIAEFLATAKRNNIPTFETVSRCRRHIQELRPELADKEVQTAREHKIEDYLDYSLTGIGDDERR